MPLDEVGQGADPVSVSQSAYALFNGVGKLQGAKEGGNRDLNAGAPWQSAPGKWI
jgi:putative DNA primase/helicase